MKGSLAASAALVASVAAAAHNGHAGFHRRNYPVAPVEDICTVYTTVYVYPSEVPVPTVNSTVYAYPTGTGETSSSSTPCTDKESETPAPPPPAPTVTPPEPSKEVYVPAPPPPEETYVAPPPEEKPKPSPKPTPPKEEKPQPPKEEKPQPPKEEKPKPPKEEKPKPEKPSYEGTGRYVTNGDKWSITYTPYTPDGQCRSKAQVEKDVKAIADLGFTTIRSYSTDCGVFENVVPECKKHGLKVIYGIFLEGGGSGGKGPFSNYANQQLQDIIKNAPKDSVAMLIVGNEAMFNGYCTGEELASYITYVKKQLSAAGFPNDIPVTTTEPVGTWEQKGKALCSVIDVFAVQVHPYFTPDVTAEKAGEFAKQQLEQAAKVCPDVAAKGKYITEIGWPKSGRANGKAVPGRDQQKKAMKDILSKVGKESVLFSYEDDLWKAPGEYGVEQSFGCSEALKY